MTDRRFDFEAADEFISFLQEEVDTVRNQVIETYFRGDGPLGKMPAFGTGGDSDGLRQKYTEFHTGVWGDLQGLIAAYEGFIEALEQTKETNEASEAVTATEFDGQLEG